MKKYIYSLLAIAVIANTTPALAQKKAYDFMVDGVKVVVQPSGNDIVEIQTVIKGGVQNYPAEKMGIEAIAMRALTECGTAKHDKNSFKNALDKVSATVEAYTSKDCSVIRMSCVKPDFDAVWPLYAEAIDEPKFDTTEFSRIKQDAINDLHQNESSPDASIDKMANKVAFAGRKYAEEPQGTPDIINHLTAAETKAYYNTILTKSRMFIVVVGDIDQATVEAKVRALLAPLKKGAPYNMPESFFRVYNNSFNDESKELATNYVEGVTSGPQLSSPDYYAFQIAMRIFADRHFLDVRTNNGLSYAPQAWFSSGSISVAKFSVSTTQPNKYIAVFDKLVDSTKRNGFTPAELADMKVTYLTGFYYKNETNAAQASSIVANEVLYNDWRKSLTLIDNVKKVTLADINNAFVKYIGNIVWVYQGDTKKVDPTLYKNGTLHQGDNPVNN
ncbi:M16 family metallopeptidase [Mucilaginibacter sp. E4BP6]|uniref:M16 family metallopeptidase n=1 Tax=Mucilaginibacter sp. E4BP6 TaxID=2723089 RepID=UPI0015C8D4A7|nr:pitrilysin family protein [Mucilaginibacter sp. E4BP6]NYE65213.1 putative Zn-dependent peptidase [Mucilaginibacter sp. E4BP6]